MTDRPILFSGPMVKAILDGKKTQTRRVVKVPDRYRNWQVGDRLWVRETFATESNQNIDSEESYPPPFNDGRPINRVSSEYWGDYWQQAHYKATDPPPDLSCESDKCRTCGGDNALDYGPHWKPSIHMPRWASRITLEVTALWEEHLDDISIEGMIDEGIEFTGSTTQLVADWYNLWNSINGKLDYGTEFNPLVKAIKFKVVRP